MGRLKCLVKQSLQQHSKVYLNKMFSLIYLASVLFYDPFSVQSFSEFIFIRNPPQSGLFIKSIVQMGICLSTELF